MTRKPDPLGVFRYTLTVYGVDVPIADADTALRISMEMQRGVGMTLSLKREWIDGELAAEKREKGEGR